MGSRYRCRVSPSGVPGCDSAGTGGTGDEPNLLAVIHERGDPVIPVAGETELLSTVVTLEESEVAIIHYEAAFQNTSDAPAALQLALFRDLELLDAAGVGTLAATDAATSDGFALDDPGPGTYEYRIVATAVEYTASFPRLLIEIVRASVVTNI